MLAMEGFTNSPNAMLAVVNQFSGCSSWYPQVKRCLKPHQTALKTICLSTVAGGALLQERCFQSSLHVNCFSIPTLICQECQGHILKVCSANQQGIDIRTTCDIPCTWWAQRIHSFHAHESQCDPSLCVLYTSLHTESRVVKSSHDSFASKVGTRDVRGMEGCCVLNGPTHAAKHAVEPVWEDLLD